MRDTEDIDNDDDVEFSVWFRMETVELSTVPLSSSSFAHLSKLEHTANNKEKKCAKHHLSHGQGHGDVGRMGRQLLNNNWIWDLYR